MSGRENPDIVPFDNDFIQDAIAEPNDNQETGRRFSRTRVVMGTVALAALAGVGAFGGYLAKAVVLNAPVLPHGTSEINADGPGKGEVTKLEVDMDSIPVTLAAAETLNLQKVKQTDNVEWDIFGWNGKIPVGDKWIMLQTGVDTYFDIYPNKVNFSYDPNEDHLTIDIPDAAVKQRLALDVANTAILDSGSVGTGNLKEQLKVLSDNARGVGNMIFNNQPTIDDYEVKPIEIKKLSDEQKIYMYGIYTTMDNVQEYCSPEVAKIDNFTEQIKSNAIDAVRGELLDIKDGGNTILSAITKDMDGDIDKVTEIVRDATVNMPLNDGYLEFAKDDEYAKKTAEIQKSMHLESGTTDKTGKKAEFTCGVSKTVTLEKPTSEGDTNE